jgi:hypothetical protein
MIGEVVPVAVNDPGEEVTVYRLLLPGFPKYEGSEKATVTCPLPAVTPVIVGADGCRPLEAASKPDFFDGLMLLSHQSKPKYLLHV